MTTSELEKNLYEFIKPAYPDIKINVEDTTDNIRQLYFLDDKFEKLYPKQRYHYIVHLIPVDFYEQNLKNTTWFELTLNEDRATWSIIIRKRLTRLEMQYFLSLETRPNS